jgi:tetratricopeptide (TPR) repeat protein
MTTTDRTAQTNVSLPRYWLRDCLWGLLLVVVTFLAYQPVWHAGFIWDDDAHLTAPALRSLRGLSHIWLQPGTTQQYYPLVHTAFWLENKLWGDAPLGYHLINIALHSLSAVLVATILRRLGILGAWFAAFLFALHPVHVESVAWVSELKNVLSAFFYLASLRIYIEFDAHRDRRAWGASLALFAMGLLSKTVIATLPAALLVILWWKRRSLSWKRDVKPLIPFFIIGVGAGLFTAWVERKFVIAGDLHDFGLTFLQRCIIATHAVCFYVSKLIWPTDLTFIYPRWNIAHPSVNSLIFPTAVLFSLAGGLIWAHRGFRAPLAAMLFFIVTLFPALGFFDVYPFLYSFVADHFQYLASLGVIAGFSAGAAQIAQPRKILVWTMELGLTALMAALTWRQGAMYSDVETLYRETIARNPRCFLAYNNLGLGLLQNGHISNAIIYFRRALEIKPDYGKAHNNLGNALTKIGEVDDAIDHLQKALQIRPSDPEVQNNIALAFLQKGQVNDAVDHFRAALQIRPRLAGAHYNLGNIFLQKGQLEEAIAHFQAAIETGGEFPEAQYNIGNAFLQEGEADKAISHLSRAVQLNPNYAEAHNNLANALISKGQVTDALAHYRKALEIKPQYADAHNNFGYALLQKGEIDLGIEQFLEALEIAPNSAEAHNNLGIVLAKGGDLDQAIRHFRDAAESRLDFHSAQRNLARALFQKGQLDEAIRWYDQVLNTSPEDVECQSDVGIALAQLGKADEAIQHLEIAVRLRPADPSRYKLLAIALAKFGRMEDAISQFESALQIEPKDANIENGLGKALLQSGRESDAILHFRYALKIDASLIDSLNNLAWVLATTVNASLRNGREAVELAERARSLTPNNPIVGGTLAAAYAESGRFPEAMATARKALQLAEVQGNIRLAETIRSHLKLYKRNIPIRSNDRSGD